MLIAATQTSALALSWVCSLLSLALLQLSLILGTVLLMFHHPAPPDHVSIIWHSLHPSLLFHIIRYAKRRLGNTNADASHVPNPRTPILLP